MQYFKPSSFVREHTGNNPKEHDSSSNTLNLFAIPFKKKDENPRAQQESYNSALWKLRDQVSLFLSPCTHTHTCTQMNTYKYCIVGHIVICLPVCQILSMKSPSFKRPVSEREWLKNSAKIWEQIKSSPTILEYYRALQHSGMYRR